MKFQLFSAILIGSVALFGIACAAPADDAAPTDDSAAAASEDLTAAHSILSGTYGERDDSAAATSFYSLTLKDNHTFSAQGGCRPNPNGPSCFAIRFIKGTWKTKTQNGKAMLELTDSFDQVTSYFYSLKADVLVLKKSAHGVAGTFDKDLSHLPKLHAMDKCADKFDNTLGFCPDNFACLEDTIENSGGSLCLPPI